MSCIKLHFEQPDLQMIYFKNNFVKNYEFFHEANNSNECFIFILFKGKAKIEYKDKIIYLKPKQMFIANKKENYKITSGLIGDEFLEIRFLQNFFHSLDPKIDILKPFYYNENIKIYDKEVMNSHFDYAVKNILRVLESRSGRPFVLSALLSLICEINYIYEDLHPTPLKETDSNFAKLYVYIQNHLFENITLKETAENTYMSEKAIKKMMKEICRTSFHKYILNLRLSEAKRMIDGKRDCSLAEIASICGFETYSTFYRGFLIKFGISPKEYKQKIH